MKETHAKILSDIRELLGDIAESQSWLAEMLAESAARQRADGGQQTVRGRVQSCQGRIRFFQEVQRKRAKLGAVRLIEALQESSSLTEQRREHAILAVRCAAKDMTPGEYAETNDLKTWLNRMCHDMTLERKEGESMTEEQNLNAPFKEAVRRRIEQYRLEHMPDGTFGEAQDVIIERFHGLLRRGFAAHYASVAESVGQEDFGLVLDVATVERPEPEVFALRDLALAISKGMSLDDFLKHGADAGAWLREHELES